MDKEVKSIVNRPRISPLSWSPILIPYIPIGLVLVLLRTVIFLNTVFASFILSKCPSLKRFVTRVMSSILGFIIHVDYDTEATNDCEAAIVSNHVSLFDHMILHLTTSCFSPYDHVFHWAFSHCTFDLRRASREDAKKLSESRAESIHLLPENCPTGDSHLLLKFDPSTFSTVEVVQPVAIIPRRIFPINLLVYPIDWRLEFFWQLFTPFTSYRLHFLAPLARDDAETDAQFADRVRNALSRALSARQVAGGSADLAASVEEASRTQQRAPAARSQTTRPMPESQPGPSRKKATDNEVRKRRIPDILVRQVIEVLPDVPESIVRRELERTSGDIDTVIADILEGRVPISLPKDQVRKGPIAPGNYLASSSTFSMRSEDRHKSFSERKELFLENARQRYLMKHPKLAAKFS